MQIYIYIYTHIELMISVMIICILAVGVGVKRLALVLGRARILQSAYSEFGFLRVFFKQTLNSKGWEFSCP